MRRRHRTDPAAQTPAATASSGPIPPPPLLMSAAAWGWRLIVLGFVALVVILLVTRLHLVVIPILVAFLFTALLRVPVAHLRTRRLRRRLAAGLVLLVAIALAGAVIYLVSARVLSQSQQISTQFTDVLSRLEPHIDQLAGGRLQASDLVDKLVHWIESHRLTTAHYVVQVGSIAVETVTISILSLFLTFFFLADGDRLWSWLVRLTPQRHQASVNGAGHAGWRALEGWIRGTTVIAAFHGVVIGASLWLLGAPLVLPLALLVFLGSFFPIVGALLFGGLAILVVLLTVGLWPAVVLSAVLIVEDQIEAHLLQPFVIGRAVHLHPVTIVLALAAGGALGGLFGAVVVVPAIAAGHAAVKYLTGVEDLHGRPLRGDRMAPIPPQDSAPLPGFESR